MTTAKPPRWRIEYLLDGSWITCNRRSSYTQAVATAKLVFREMRYAYPVSVIGEDDPEIAREVLG